MRQAHRGFVVGKASCQASPLWMDKAGLAPLLCISRFILRPNSHPEEEEMKLWGSKFLEDVWWPGVALSKTNKWEKGLPGELDLNSNSGSMLMGRASSGCRSSMTPMDQCLGTTVCPGETICAWVQSDRIMSCNLDWLGVKQPWMRRILPVGKEFPSHPGCRGGVGVVFSALELYE